MFRAFYTPVIRGTISTVSTASGTNRSIVSATFFQRGLVLTATVSTASGTNHSIVSATFFQRGLVLTQWNKIDCKQLHLVGHLKEYIFWPYFMLLFFFFTWFYHLFVFAFSYRRVTKRIKAIDFIAYVFPPIRSIRVEKRISHQTDVIFGTFTKIGFAAFR